MISRYSRKEMSSIWEPKNKFRIWFEIEAYACDAQSELGLMSKEDAKTIWEKGNFDISRIDEIEKVTKHDVIAFLTNLAEYVGEPARFIHQGMTSSDILDTCLSVQLSQASDILLDDIDKLLEVLKQRALEHKYTVRMGRSHAIHAEPTTFGLTLLRFYSEMKRNKARLLNAKKEISVCAISGVVGTFANIDPFVESYVAKSMNLDIEPISTQVIPRDRHAMFFATLSVIGASIENIATEIRHMQRTELREVEELFSKGQKGSSAMPHKRNPVLTENLTGLARIIRMSVIPALENVTLWHERDISHSSVERTIAPDTTITLDFALHRLTNVIDNLVVYPEEMKNNIDKLNGLHNSQRILLALTKNGVSREDAYVYVQRNAMKSWEQGISFKDLLKKDTDINSILDDNVIDDMFDLEYHMKHIETIFDRVFDS